MNRWVAAGYPQKPDLFWRDAGLLPKVSELCRKHGMSDAALYTWKAKYGGMTVSELRRVKGLEAENAELKRLLADAMLNNAVLTGLLAKNSYRLPPDH